MVRQKQNIRLALDELGERNLENVQTVVKVFAERAMLHHGFEILAGARNEAYVAALLDVTAETLETLFLNKLKKLDLRGERQVGNFI